MTNSTPSGSNPTISDQASTLRQMAQKRYAKKIEPKLMAEGSPTQVFTITSGKGGVGKTIVVSNLAICLSRLSKKTLILDADLGLANLDVVMGLETEYDLSHVVSGEKQLSEIIIKGPENIHIIPAASGDESLANLDDVGRLNIQAQFEALQESADYLLIDSGAGISSNVIFFNLAAQYPIVIVTPEPTSLTDAYAVIKILSQDHDVKHCLIIVNRARTTSEGEDVYNSLLKVTDRFLKSVSLECLGYLPEDESINKSIRKQTAVVQAFPEAPVSKAFEKLAVSLAAIPFNDTNVGHPGFMRDRNLLRG